MIHIVIVVLLLGGFLFLLRRRLIQLDLLFPWLFGIAVLAIPSLYPGFVDRLGDWLDILYPPLAVLFIVIFLLLGVIIMLSIGFTRLRERQTRIIRQMAAADLDGQERALDEKLARGG